MSNVRFNSSLYDEQMKKIMQEIESERKQKNIQTSIKSKQQAEKD